MTATSTAEAPRKPLRIASLCSGVGALDLAVESVIDAELALALSLIVQAHDEDVAAAKIPTPTQEFLAGPPASRWLPMDEAPHDGTEIIGLINGDEVPIHWNDEDRHCAGTGVARGASVFTPDGVEQVEVTAYVLHYGVVWSYR